MGELRMVKLATRLAHLLLAMENCEKSGNMEWHAKHRRRLSNLIDTYIPSGSGFDAGCAMQEGSTPERLIFSADFHHMDSHGGYAGWTTHQVIVTPSLVHGFTIKVTGRDRNLVKDHIAGAFESALSTMVEEYGPIEEVAA